MVYKKRLESSAPVRTIVGRTADCSAHGCPFPGGIRLTNYASVCRVHDELPAQFWPVATERICRRVDELDRAIAASNASPKDCGPYERLIAEFRAGLA